MCTCVGCSSKEEQKITTNVLNHKDKEFSYDVISKPDDVYSKEMQQFYILSQGVEFPCFILEMKRKGKDTPDYFKYELNDDNAWNVEKTAWSDKLRKIIPGGVDQMVSDSQGTIYGLSGGYGDDKNSVLVRMDGEGTVTKMNLSSVKKAYPELSLQTFQIINDNELIFYFSAEDEGEEEKKSVEALTYNVTTESMDKKVKVTNDLSCFDKQGNYYTITSEQNAIQKRNLEDELPSQLILCEGNLSGCLENKIIVNGDWGYVVTNQGICGGRLDADKWDVLIPQDKMYYNKGNFRVPVEAFPVLMKTNGQDEDFFVMTYKDKEFMDFDWVHYHE